MIILYSDNKEIKLDVKDESYSYEAIMAEDTLNLYFSYPGYIRNTGRNLVRLLRKALFSQKR